MHVFQNQLFEKLVSRPNYNEIFIHQNHPLMEKSHSWMKVSSMGNKTERPSVLSCRQQLKQQTKQQYVLSHQKESRASIMLNKHQLEQQPKHPTPPTKSFQDIVLNFSHECDSFVCQK